MPWSKLFLCLEYMLFPFLPSVHIAGASLSLFKVLTLAGSHFGLPLVWIHRPSESTLVCLYIDLVSVLSILTGVEELMGTWQMHAFSDTKKGTRACFCQDVGAGGMEQTWQEEEMADMAGRLVTLSHFIKLVSHCTEDCDRLLTAAEGITSTERWDSWKKPWDTGLELEILVWTCVLKCDMKCE